MLSPTDARSINSTTKHAVHMLYIEHGKGYWVSAHASFNAPASVLGSHAANCAKSNGRLALIFGNGPRHCVAPGHREKGRFAAPIANALLSGMVEWGLESGISTAIIEIEPILLLRLVQLHFRMLPLGLPQRIGKQDFVAVTATFDWRTLNRLREMRGDRRRVLAEKLQVPALLHA